MKNDLSILIPTYNDACTQLVSDLQRQAERLGMERYEIVVADDGSTDATLDYIESFNDSRIRIIRSGGHPLGPTYNMERALM